MIPYRVNDTTISINSYKSYTNEDHFYLTVRMYTAKSHREIQMDIPKHLVSKYKKRIGDSYLLSKAPRDFLSLLRKTATRLYIIHWAQEALSGNPESEHFRDLLNAIQRT